MGRDQTVRLSDPRRSNNAKIITTPALLAAVFFVERRAAKFDGKPLRDPGSAVRRSPHPRPGLPTRSSRPAISPPMSHDRRASSPSFAIDSSTSAARCLSKWPAGRLPSRRLAANHPLGTALSPPPQCPCRPKRRSEQRLAIRAGNRRLKAGQRAATAAISLGGVNRATSPRSRPGTVRRRAPTSRECTIPAVP